MKWFADTAGSFSRALPSGALVVTSLGASGGGTAGAKAMTPEKLKEWRGRLEKAVEVSRGDLRLLLDAIEELMGESTFLRGLIHDLREERSIPSPRNFDWKEFTSELKGWARNGLNQQGIDSLEKLCNLTEGDILEMRNMGTVCLGQIKQALAKRGLSLRP